MKEAHPDAPPHLSVRDVMQQWDRQSRQISTLDWVLKINDSSYRELASSTVDSTRIVTTWMGVANGFDLEARPIIFETAVYRDGSLIKVRRYASEQDATFGHDEECDAVRSAT